MGSTSDVRIQDTLIGRLTQRGINRDGDAPSALLFACGCRGLSGKTLDRARTFVAQQNYDLGFRPSTYAELREMNADHIVALFDSLSPRSRPGGVEFNDPNFWLAELQRRNQEAVNKSVLRLTWWIAGMTVVITLATLSMLWASLRVAQVV